MESVMTKEWLQWFFAQKPYRASMLILMDGTKVPIAKPEHIGFNINDTIRICQDKGMGMQTVEIADIVEIRQ